MSRQISSLTQRAGFAVSVRIGGNFAGIILGLCLSIIIARLVPPAEFGLFGVGMGITAVVEIFGTFGMLQALVQRKTISRDEEGTAAIMQAAAAMFLVVGLLIAATLIQNLFEMPGLGLLIQLQSTVLVLNAFGVIPISRLSRNLAFHRLAAIELTTKALGGVVAIVLALYGLGALALTIGNITTALGHTSLAWLAAPGRFSLQFSVRSAKHLLSFGTGILFSRICNEFARRLDVLIVGHRLGAEIVGLYQRSFQVVSIPLYQFTGAISTVLFPAMASLQDDTVRFKKAYLSVVGLTSIIAFPLLTIVWTTADILVPLLYGPMWEGAVPILVSLAFVGYVRTLNNPNGLVAQTRGRVMSEAFRQALFMIMTASFTFLGAFYGIQGVILGIGIASLVFLITMTRLALAISSATPFMWLRRVRTAVLSSVLMAVAVLTAKIALVGYLSNLFLVLFILGVCGVSVYLLSLRRFVTSEEREIIERVVVGVPGPFRRICLLLIGSSVKS